MESRKSNENRISFRVDEPFNALAEGLVSENSRENKTAIELFLTGIWGREAGLRRKPENRK